MPFSSSNYPEELKNIPVNVDDIIGAVGKESKQSGNNGLLGVDNLVIALGQAVPSLLNVNAQVPNVALGLVSSLVSGLTGSLDVSSLLNVLGGMNSNANLNEIFSAVAGVTGGSLSGQLPSSIGSVTGVLAPLQKLLGSLGGGSISPEKLVGLIGSIVPQLLAVTPVQVLSGTVNQIIVGVVGLLNALLGGLLGGNGVAGGLLNGLLGGLSGGANSGVGNLLGSLTRSF
ncbi:uncharacterized protein LOC116338869 [Contarinia nasturtii]|uniref:uncharacterized protein LOC116338869 n=1 Tax=Contarinia nasturtii TaxID=265458 RepID=UPI0012D4AA62|nr:uncharacterized protein LOC116338869 [Contarinia nasturtii]